MQQHGHRQTNACDHPPETTRPSPRFEVPEFLLRLIDRLQTQQHRFTPNPIFVVRQARFFPAHEGFDPDGWQPVSHDGDHQGPAFEDVLDAVQWVKTLLEQDGFDDAEGSWASPGPGYDIWPVWIYREPVAFFFTEAAAQTFMTAKSHRLNDPDIGVVSMNEWGDDDLKPLRLWLRSLKTNPSIAEGTP